MLVTYEYDWMRMTEIRIGVWVVMELFHVLIEADWIFQRIELKSILHS